MIVRSYQHVELHGKRFALIPMTLHLLYNQILMKTSPVVGRANLDNWIIESPRRIFDDIL